MLKVIAILVLSSSLNVAVETDSGWVERSFSNTEKGAEELVEFAEQVVGDPPDGVRVVLGASNEEVNLQHIVELFASLGLAHGFVTPDEVKEAVLLHQLPSSSGVAVAKADLEKFGAFYRPKPPR